MSEPLRPSSPTPTPHAPDLCGADALLPAVYRELHACAGKLMAGERAGHTLGRTALVHEAYLKLAQAGAQFESKLHFVNAAALAMRHILSSYAQGRARQKRGGGRARVALDDDVVDLAATFDQPPRQADWTALDEALNELTKVSPRQAQVVSLRFFAGQPETEVADLLGMSVSTVRRDWATARLWLCRHMSLQRHARDPSLGSGET